jgi:hypothetical protein
MQKDPGFYPNTSFDEYASWDAINHSKLIGFKDTPAHARYLFLNEKPSTKAKEFGFLAHLAILEPERLWRECIVRPNVDGRTKEGRPILAEFKEKAKGKLIIKQDEADKLTAITRNIRAHATANEYVTGKGFNEVSIVWVDKETQLRCKARLDRIAVVSTLPGVHPDMLPQTDQFMLVIDVKTLGKVATLRNFERAIYDNGYATQAAMYLEGLNTVFPADEMRPFVWLVPETDPPHLIRLFTPNPDLLEWGHQSWHKWLRTYAECEKSGDWPGWDEGIEEASLPPWAAKVWEATL